jgi:hypothetical protein
MVTIASGKTKNLQLAANLKHGNKIKVIKFSADPCGGDVYIEAKVKGQPLLTHSLIMLIPIDNQGGNHMFGLGR